MSWDKKEGEEVRRGDVVAQVETDKAIMDMEAPRHGFIAKFLVGTGTKDILLGTVSALYMCGVLGRGGVGHVRALCAGREKVALLCVAALECHESCTCSAS